MLSYSIVYRIGVELFIRHGAEAGIDGLIVPDLSLEEAPADGRASSAGGLCMPMLVSPVSAPTAAAIAALSTGFVYYMSVTGITGERPDLPPELIDNVRHLREASGQPVVVGFGISTAEHVRRVCTRGRRGDHRQRPRPPAHAGRGRRRRRRRHRAAAADAVREWMAGLS